MAAPASTPTNTIAALLRKLGLRQRGLNRDFTIEGRYEGSRCVETYVVPLNPSAKETIAAAAPEIARATAESPFPFELHRVAGPDGKPVDRLVCRVATERKTMKPRSTPKRYKTRTGAPASDDLPDGKVGRLINILGPVWGDAKNRAQANGLSISHVSEQLLAAYADGEFQFDTNGTLIPPRPSTEHTRKILLESLQDYFTGPGRGQEVGLDAIVEALTTTLHNAGYTRPE